MYIICKASATEQEILNDIQDNYGSDEVQDRLVLSFHTSLTTAEEDLNDKRLLSDHKPASLKDLGYEVRTVWVSK